LARVRLPPRRKGDEPPGAACNVGPQAAMAKAPTNLLVLRMLLNRIDNDERQRPAGGDYSQPNLFGQSGKDARRAFDSRVCSRRGRVVAGVTQDEIKAAVHLGTVDGLAIEGRLSMPDERFLRRFSKPVTALIA